MAQIELCESKEVSFLVVCELCRRHDQSLDHEIVTSFAKTLVVADKGLHTPDAHVNTSVSPKMSRGR